jgi:hypothetical protein
LAEINPYVALCLTQKPQQLRLIKNADLYLKQEQQETLDTKKPAMTLVSVQSWMD